jgi:prepilin-type N-terminal cleavage/methylation domain-containing protein
MKAFTSRNRRGFTLMETVIAIGVLAVLLTGFIVVFTPAADGIRKTISTQQADRLTSALEQELVTLRGPTETTDFKTGFNKAYTFIKESNVAAEALLVYQYRGDLEAERRNDGSLEPLKSIDGKLPGEDYLVVPMARRLSDDIFIEDLAAVEGPVYLVKPTQLIYDANQLVLGELGKIKYRKVGESTYTNSSDADEYEEAVIAFAAEFHPMPTNAAGYFTGPEFAKKFAKAKTPVFTRNLAVRR